jgi:hypothetical protein
LQVARPDLDIADVPSENVTPMSHHADIDAHEIMNFVLARTGLETRTPAEIEAGVPPLLSMEQLTQLLTSGAISPDQLSIRSIRRA